MTVRQAAAGVGGTASPTVHASSLLAGGPMARNLWRFRREFAWAGLFSLIANVMMLTPTLYLLQVFDRVLVSGSKVTLAAVTLLAVLFFAVMGFAEWVRSRLLVRTGAAFDAALNRQVFDAGFDAALVGTARSPLQPFNDLLVLRQFLTGNGAFAVFDLPWSPIYVGVLFLMHPWLGWTSVAFVLLLGTVAVLGRTLTSPRLRRAQDGVVESNAFVHAKLRNVETVHALGMAGHLRRLWVDLQDRQGQRQAEALAASQRLNALSKFLQYAQPSMILAVGAVLVIDGEISVGAMIASNALMAMALRPISTIAGTWRQFIDARQAFGRLDELLVQQPTRRGAHAADTVTGQVTLDGLTARAAGRDQPILHGLEAEFRAGEVVAIVGPSGAGKSTLARCLVGIWPGAEQQVRLDGRPIGDWDREALGPHLGYLPQDIELLNGTIAENIARFGNVDSDQVIEAATRTGIHDMVLRLPRGYDTPMGEAGQLLSGGQRQRVGLARAIYGDPALVVLDEPSSNLDDAGEAALVRAVCDLRARGRTVFMVVHQRQLLAAADRVLVLEQGRVARISAVAVRQPAAPTPDPSK